MTDPTHGPELPDLYSLFATGVPPPHELLAADDVPEPYHRLLVHDHHMTVTVEEFYGSRVDVRVRAEGGSAVLEVADTGAGIPADEQRHVFERFFRASGATEAEVPGTGLGLAISREIAEAHGGTIAVESTEGAGSTFRAALPGEGGT